MTLIILPNYFLTLLCPIPSLPALITEVTSTLIDNIFTNNLTETHNSGIFYTDISDHFPMFSILSSQVIAKANIKYITSRKITSSGQCTYQHDIVNSEWTAVLQADNPNNSYDAFISIINAAYDKSFSKLTKNQI